MNMATDQARVLVGQDAVAPVFAAPLEVFLNVVEQFAHSPLQLQMTLAEYKFTLSSLSRVCHLSRKTAQRYLYSFLTFSGQPEDVGDEEIYLNWHQLLLDGDESYGRLAKHVKTLYISNWPENPDAEPAYMDIEYPLLTELCKALVSTAQYMPNVEMITLNHLPIFDSMVSVVAAYPRLENLLFEEWDAEH